MVRLILLTVLMLPLSGWHPLHVSICEIDFDRGRKALEITQRIFFDDLELELRRELKDDKLDIIDGISSEKRDELLESYLRRHLEIQLDGKLSKFEYLGHEIETDVIYCYFQILSVQKLDKITVRNDILLNYYDDQINLVHISEKDKVKSMRLLRSSPSDEIIF